MAEQLTFDELSGNLPWPDRTDVNLHTNEYVQQSTLNRCLNRLLENDRFIYYNMLWLSDSTLVDFDANRVAQSNDEFLKIIKDGKTYLIPVYEEIIEP